MGNNTAPVPGVDAAAPGDPPWLRSAFQHLGEEEIAGPGSNPIIMEYWNATYQAGLHADDSGREHAWCAALVTWHLAASNFKTKRAVGAREYINYGEPCVLFRGAIVVLERKKQKHVAFAAGMNPDGHTVYLGGNQANRVSLATFPMHKVLATRKPWGYVVPERLLKLPTIDVGAGSSTV